MRTEIITNHYAAFNELTQEQRAKALEDNQSINVDDVEWWDSTYDDFKDALLILGFNNSDFHFSGFSSQGDGACIYANYDFMQSKEDMRGAWALIDKDMPYMYDQELRDLFMLIPTTQSLDDQILHEYGKVTTRGRYCHSNTMQCDCLELLIFLKAFADKLYTQLEKEYDYLMSDEAIIETLISNEIEFKVSSEVN